MAKQYLSILKRKGVESVPLTLVEIQYTTHRMGSPNGMRTVAN